MYEGVLLMSKQQNSSRAATRRERRIQEEIERIRKEGEAKRQEQREIDEPAREPVEEVTNDPLYW